MSYRLEGTHLQAEDPQSNTTTKGDDEGWLIDTKSRNDEDDHEEELNDFEVLNSNDEEEEIINDKLMSFSTT
jgi:hypothetical protein